MMKTVLVTGSAGLIGSEAVKWYCERGCTVVGVDNDMRRRFFGAEASTTWNRLLLEEKYPGYKHHSIDIRDKDAMAELFHRYPIDLIIHAAAQPSHDWAARDPMMDFSVNAVGTLVLLELTRQYAPDAVFIFTSTNKVYGDRPNHLPLVEKETRWEVPEDHPYHGGIDESMSVDACLHSVFGASKVAADVMVQEYGKYFGLKTGVFRGGCLTGPAHSGTKLHGFLAYLARCIARGEQYTIIGYKGKQVRDNIHSADVLSAFDTFAQNPHPGEVYNLGGTRVSNVSMLEAVAKFEELFRTKAVTRYQETNRIGDHIWYISDMSKFQRHYPGWKHRYDTDAILEEIAREGQFS